MLKSDKDSGELKIGTRGSPLAPGKPSGSAIGSAQLIRDSSLPLSRSRPTATAIETPHSPRSAASVSSPRRSSVPCWTVR